MVTIFIGDYNIAFGMFYEILTIVDLYIYSLLFVESSIYCFIVGHATYIWNVLYENGFCGFYFIT